MSARLRHRGTRRNKNKKKYIYTAKAQDTNTDAHAHTCKNFHTDPQPERRNSDHWCPSDHWLESAPPQIRAKRGVRGWVYANGLDSDQVGPHLSETEWY